MSVGRISLIGIVGGVFSGLLGVGGGTVMVPLLVAGGLNQRSAHAISLAAIIVLGVASATTYGVAGKIDLTLSVALLAGALVGAPIGARMLATLPEHTIKLVFGIFLVGVSASLVVTT